MKTLFSSAHFVVQAFFYLTESTPLIKQWYSFENIELIFLHHRFWYIIEYLPNIQKAESRPVDLHKENIEYLPNIQKAERQTVDCHKENKSTSKLY
jgi:hypothetical protein